MFSTGFQDEFVMLPTIPEFLAGELPISVSDEITMKFCCRQDSDTNVTTAMPFNTAFVFIQVMFFFNLRSLFSDHFFKYMMTA